MVKKLLLKRNISSEKVLNIRKKNLLLERDFLEEKRKQILPPEKQRNAYVGFVRRRDIVQMSALKRTRDLLKP